jgi:signal transduction histidine kinase
VSLSLAASAATNGNPGTAEAMRGTIDEAASETRETIRELRTLLVDIYPPTLQRSGLRAALDDLVAPLTAAGISARLDVPASLQLPDNIEALFYRIAQEAVRNAKSHSKATEVAISVELGPRQAILSVVDDGRGFSLDDRRDDEQQESHFGLRLMGDLAEHAGGQLEVRSSPGTGASVRLTVPLR